MTTIQNKTNDPTSHLTADDIEAIGRELDAIRAAVMDSRGEDDAAYIRKVIDVQRKLELGSRAVLLASLFPPAWVIGTAGLSVAKILENMEIGHNVMHGQWDWMRDPKIHSTTWEWDNASPSDMWKHSHNELHHTYTNVVGRDNDLGYGIMRVDEDQRWSPFFLAQPLWNLVNAFIFEYGIAAYDLEIGKHLKGRSDPVEFKDKLRNVGRKIRKQMTRDYVVHPLLSGPSAVPTLLANVTANVVRNLWTHSVIMCGHFPEGVETFEKTSIEGETRGEWYLRQMLGAANIDGGAAMHMMTGNLSFQIEHHLFPDMPSKRYAEIAPQVQDHERLGATAVRLGLITEAQLVAALAAQLHIATVDPDAVTPTDQALSMVPEAFATSRELLPLRYEAGGLVVAMADPTNIMLLDDVRTWTRVRDVAAVVAPRQPLLRAIADAYLRLAQPVEPEPPIELQPPSWATQRVVIAPTPRPRQTTATARRVTRVVRTT